MVKLILSISCFCIANIAIAQVQDIILTAKTIAVGTVENYEAEQTIVSPAGTNFIVEGECELKAGVEIVLGDGFEAKAGADFHAFIKVAPSSYANLTRSLDASFYICQGGVFKFKFDEKYYQDGELLVIKFRDAAHQVVYQPLDLLKYTGVNTYSVDLAATGFFTDDTFYTVEITGTKSRTSYLRILYKDY